MLEDTGIGLAKLRLVEGIAELLGGLGHFLVDLLLDLRQVVLDQDIGTITLLRVLIIDQRVVERVDVARGFPDCRVHEDGGIDAHNVLVEQRHAVPPIFLDIIFQLHSILAVIVYRS